MRISDEFLLVAIELEQELVEQRVLAQPLQNLFGERLHLSQSRSLQP
jgi:hypothetical protein